MFLEKSSRVFCFLLTSLFSHLCFLNIVTYSTQRLYYVHISCDRALDGVVNVNFIVFIHSWFQHHLYMHEYI